MTPRARRPSATHRVANPMANRRTSPSRTSRTSQNVLYGRLPPFLQDIRSLTCPIFCSNPAPHRPHRPHLHGRGYSLVSAPISHESAMTHTTYDTSINRGASPPRAHLCSHIHVARQIAKNKRETCTVLKCDREFWNQRQRAWQSHWQTPVRVCFILCSLARNCTTVVTRQSSTNRINVISISSSNRDAN